MAAKKEQPANTNEAQQLTTLHQSLFEVRRQLHSGEIRLWKTFNIKRDFDAFSIHELAHGVETALAAAGISCRFRYTSWVRDGNHNLIEGFLEFYFPSAPGVFIAHPAIGEGVDGGDKGINKAISSARKNGFVTYFNLAAGINVEDDDAQKTTETQQTKSGVFTIIADGTATNVPLDQLAGSVVSIVAKFKNQADLDDFVNANRGELRRAYDMNRDVGNIVSQIIKGRTSALSEGDDAARAA